MKGRLIVIDGPDSVGKSTQTELLARRFRQAGRRVTVTDFPRYNEPSGYFAKEYLKGKFGTADEVGPFVASIFFGVDRYAAAIKMRQALNRGDILISNRYVTASMAHQGLKIANTANRLKFYSWVEELEYMIFNIPKPDIHIFLHMPYKVSLRLMDTRKNKAKDIHENDLNHLKRAEQTYLEIARKFKYPLIRSVIRNKLQKPSEINERIWQITKLKLKA